MDVDLDSDSSSGDSPPVKRPRIKEPVIVLSDSEANSGDEETRGVDSVEESVVESESEVAAIVLSSDSDQEMKFRDSEMPTFASGPIKFDAAELVRILLDKERHSGFVCNQQPLRINDSKVFVVNTDKLSHPDDLKADDLGSWRNDGHNTRWIRVNQKAGHVRKVEFCSGRPQRDPSAYCLHRQYFVHHSNNHFKRKIVYLTDCKGNRHSLTLLQYISPDPAGVVIKPHGNAKSSEPYLRTSKSTLHAIKNEVKSASPKEAIELVSIEKGGEMSAKSAGALPRNRQQAYNASKLQKPQDPLYNLILESQNLEQSDNQFVREVKLTPEPTVIIAMDYQIADLEAFCTSPHHYSVLGIDPTFNLGPFNVTVSTYKQLQLVKRNGEPPTFVGPLFLHYRKSFSCYNSFASGLLGLNKNLSKIRAFGTDGEEPLIEAFQQQCQFATHVTCFTHCRQNIKRKLRDLSVPKEIVSEYLFEIFGGRRGTTFVEGLADASSDDDFDEKLTLLEEPWNDREKPFSFPPQFFCYFKKHKATTFKNSMIKPVREKAGLGNPPSEYHNNCPECINHVIKMKVDRKKNTLDEFCHKMKSLVQDQKNHLIRAVTSRGEYRLHPVFKEFEVSPSQWFGLKETDRTHHIQRLQSAASKYMEKLHLKTSATQSTSKALLPNLEESRDRPKEGSTYSSHDDGDDSSKEVESTCDSHTICDSDSSQNSIDGEVVKWVTKIAKNTTVPESTVSSIFEKAKELLADSKAITAAPLQEEARMVRSKSNPFRPHLVQIVKGAKIVCDETCPMWTSLKLCSHCVAVAHTVGCVSAFVEWYVANAKKVNITKLTTKNVPRSVGKKLSHSCYSQRKGKMPITARVPPAFANKSANCDEESIAATSISSSALPFFNEQSTSSELQRNAEVNTHNLPPRPWHVDPYSYMNPSLHFLSSPSFTSPMSSPFSTHGTNSSYVPSSPLSYGPSGSYPPSSGHGAGSSYPPTNFPTNHGASMPPYNPTHPHTYGTSCSYTPLSFPSCYGPSMHPSLGYGATSAPSQPHYLFWVSKLNKRITTCYGCRGKFTRAADGSVPVPPLDLILKCNESRHYYDKDGNMQEKGNCNTYYHPNVSCIKKKHPEFQSTDIRIEETMRASLVSTHFELLRSVFNISLQ